MKLKPREVTWHAQDLTAKQSGLGLHLINILVCSFIPKDVPGSLYHYSLNYLRTAPNSIHIPFTLLP